MHVASLHAVEIVFSRAFLAFLDHRVAVRQLAGEDVAEYFGVAVPVRGEAGLACYAVLVQDAEGSKVLEFRLVIAGEGDWWIR